ncbi:hypothetical protein OHC33_000743 [Knufia fluminis]|uniref:Nucleoporin Nup159/Nup146 N-terminal domain-containing protein n=1 Tax=Knufia fluminis TaxID=191047 RepID=A0AAN8EMC1_9EURO|nr:hypothetical protein OHC33_000743 [Knufia fluminis]
MAFSMNGMSSGFGAGASGPTMNDGEELPEIQAEGLGFKTLHGDKKARLLKDGWPADALPPPFASLLSIASARGLYAAGGPDVVVVGKTQDARDRIYDTQGEDVRICAPLHSLPHSRPVHLAFAADESCLVVAEQNAPEIVAYRTEDLAAKKSNVALKLSTNAPLRMLAPNPDPAQSQYFALVNTNGQLLLADLGSNQLTSGANGPVLAENVSCVEWSTKGKQLIAGKGDGTAVQLKPDGTVVANIPKPDSVPANCFLARIAWLENDVFFFVYTPTSPSDPQEAVSEYYLVKTNKGRTEFTLRKPVELLYPSVDRLPAHFFMSRLRNYKPHLDELLIVSGTVSSEVKLITKASRPLSDEAGENEPYTNTVPQDEQRWAALPMGLDGSSDTTPIGMAIDLSDKDPVLKPIPADSEIETSTIPVPELVALNNEGILSIWAVVYDDAVRSQQVYPGFEEVSRLRQNLPRVSTGNTVAAPTPVAAPQTAEPTGSPFATPTPATSALQPPSNTATTSDSKQQSQAFGAGSSFGNGSGFSKPTPIGGETKPSWASSGFGGDNIKAQSGGFGQAPAFGSTPTLGSKPAFGQSGGIGQQTSGAPAFGQTGFGSKPAFGQTGFGAQSGQSSPFASKPPAASSPFAGAGANTQSGFGSFAGQGGGFASNNKDNKAENSFGSAFGKGGGFGEAKASSPFSSAGKTAQSPFGQPSGPSVFGKPSPLSGAAPATSSPFGQAATKGFQLESTFQKDETSKDEDDDKQDTSSGFGFGGLGNMLGGNKAKEAQQSPSKEEEMKDDEESVTEVESTKKPQETPPATINQPKTSTTPHVSSLFGNNQQESTTPQTQPKSSLTTGWGFGNHPSTTPKDTPAPSRSIFGTQPISQDTPAAVQKSEPNKPFSFKPMPSEISDSDRIKSLSDSDEEEDQSDEENDEPTKTPEAPLPPNPFSKPDYQAGDTSASSINSKTSREPEDAPLPPGFAPANKNASRSLKTQESEPPSEGLSDEFAGSGEDVTGDVSPVEERDSGPSDAGEQTEHVETSPESSFGNATDRSAVASPTGGLFTKVSKIEQAKPPPRLFGEMGTSVPSFAPPKPQESPRSPSPMRKPPRHATLSRSPERSFSAPAHSRSIMQQRKLEHQQSPFATQAAQARDEEMARERARIDAARQAQEAAEAMETQPLIDEEDEILQAELAKPTEPSENLDPFLPSQDVSQSQEVDQGRTDVPSQIEKLYQDINSMVMTLGINAKSLSAYMMYQSGQEPDDNWPDVLTSDTPMDAMNEEWFFGDIDRIPAGTDALDRVLDGLEMKDVMQKLEDCQNLLTKEVTDLRGRITALRRSTQARAQPENNTHAPLSAEQASIQQDLRRASAVVLTNLAQVEDNLVVLRAKLADIAPSKISSEKQSMLGMMSSAQKKPSVEAVMSTVTKMTSMAEKRSADVDVLEAQLRKLNMSTSMNGTQEPSTPERRISRRNPATPGSGASSIFYTPDSKGSRSGRATPKNQQPVVPVEDSEKWQAKARRRKEVANVLKDVLREKHGKAKA